MPRGRAADTLPEEVAVKIRTAVATARELKGLTNSDLAQRLDWDERTVTNALQSGRPLRLPNAKRILYAVTKLPPRDNARRLSRERAWDIHKKAFKVLAPALAAVANIQTKLYPAVLIEPSDIGLFTERLTDAIVLRSGFSKQKRRIIEQAISAAIYADAGMFAFAALQRLENMFVRPKPPFSERAATHVLARFGYKIVSESIS